MINKYKMTNKQEEIGDVKRSSRNLHSESLEESILEKAPLPISYDVDPTQGVNFTELAYSEFLGGAYVFSQNLELNTRHMQNCLNENVEILVNLEDKLNKFIDDKYELNNLDIRDDELDEFTDIGFMVGQNMFDLVSSEIVARLAFENPKFKLKLHPLTSDESMRLIGRTVGIDKIIPANISGVQMLKLCEVAYVHTATELCSMAVLLNKKIVNISNFFNESAGLYYPINRILFNNENPKNALLKLISNPKSGIIFPFMDDIEYRLDAYYTSILELREKYKPIASDNKLRKIPIKEGENENR